ncbi:sensor histidine kinase [Glycomyces xiaoerkulensis]|uniref:sensor histidine kinase n=1 Tax=Glycomyces xiaoerkulensis TaxID=2038139 RepID=UPI000C2605E5|nr:sensor histidine kinase [Glycomyces xiaoerkulensis]
MLKTLRQLGIDTGYNLSSFAIALAAFVVTVTGLSAGSGTVAIWVGIPVLAATMFAMRGLAAAGRAQLPLVLRRKIAKPRYRRAPEGSSGLRRFLTILIDGQAWLNLLWAVAVFPVAVASFAITIAWWSTTLATLLYPLYGWIIWMAVGREDQGIVYATEWLGWGDSYLAASVLAVLGGLVFAATLYPVVRGLALAQAHIGRGLLTTVGGLHQRIDVLEESRDAATSAEADALRRIERDIHDGPQQRLVGLGMELARVRRQMEANPEAAQKTLESAISQTRDTIDELRALSRGIAPPILTDRGLEAALAALTARSNVPVDLETNLDRRYRANVESTVYFVVAEALTNTAKHADATQASVTVDDWGDRLVVSIGDNGVGGAHVAKGHGLSGLADRIKATEGGWTLDSPEGGPTVIVAEVPCE